MINRQGIWLDVRWFELGDLPQIVRLHASAFPCELCTEQSVCAFAEREGGACLVAVDPTNDEVVATLCYVDLGATVEVTHCAVAERMRRQHVGTRMMRQLTGGGRPRGVKFVARARERDVVAHLFLRSLGFRAVAPYRDDAAFADGEAAIPFELESRGDAAGRIRRRESASV